MSMIEVKISGKTYSAADHYTIKQQTGAISISDIDVIVPASYAVPVAKEAVQILCNGTPFFFGYISTVESPEFKTGKEAQRYRLEINSAEVILKNRLINEAYTSTYTHNIVQNLFENYIKEEGFTLGSISTTARYWEAYNAAYYNLYTALQELADDVGALFYISPDKKFYFMLKSDLVHIDMPAHVTSLKRNENADNMITEQTISGATEETTEQTEQFLWNTNDNAFQQSCNLAYPVASISAVYIGEKIDTGMSWTQVSYGVKGTDDDDTTKTFLYAEGSTTLALNSKAVTKPTSSVPYVKLVYIGTYDIIVTDTNITLQSELAKLSGTSGKIEAYKSDSTIETFADADTAATNLLNQNDEWTEEISAKCRELDKTDLYMSWDIQSTDTRISGAYYIVERTIEDFGPDDMLITVQLKNRDLYSRYGTCIKNTVKVKRADVLVYKTDLYGERITLSDTFKSSYNEAPYYLHYPVSSSSLIADPDLIDGMSSDTYSSFRAPAAEAQQISLVSIYEAE